MLWDLELVVVICRALLLASKEWTTKNLDVATSTDSTAKYLGKESIEWEALTTATWLLLW
jgi:hypothetical protein